MCVCVAVLPIAFQRAINDSCNCGEIEGSNSRGGMGLFNRRSFMIANRLGPWKGVLPVRRHEEWRFRQRLAKSPAATAKSGYSKYWTESRARTRPFRSIRCNRRSPLPLPCHPAIKVNTASKVAVVPGVRKVLVAEQRRAGESGGVVMEGRDIGSVVFPDAHLRIFLTASPKIRATLRGHERKGDAIDLGRTLVEIHERDRRAASTKYCRWSRRLTPWVVDSTAMEAEEVARLVVMLTQELAKEEEMRLDSAAE